MIKRDSYIMIKDVFYLPSFKQLTAQKEALTHLDWLPFSTHTLGSITTQSGVCCIAHTKQNQKQLDAKVLYIFETTNLHQQLLDFTIADSNTAQLFKKTLLTDRYYSYLQTDEQIQTFIKKECAYKYLVIANDRNRLFLEHGLKFSLSPRFLTKHQFSQPSYYKL